MMRSNILLSISAVVLLVLTGSTALAQMPTPDVSPTVSPVATPDTTTPGVPGTGAGGDAALNVIILGSSALITVAGIALLRRNTAA